MQSGGTTCALDSPEMQKLKRENYPEYRKIYPNQKLFIKGKMVAFRD